MPTEELVQIRTSQRRAHSTASRVSTVSEPSIPPVALTSRPLNSLQKSIQYDLPVWIGRRRFELFLLWYHIARNIVQLSRLMQ